ncbi:(2Fe-2S)-binding protein [Iodidimonas nitroreducens]|uniref:Bacterioferritin-associated ferredoxin n=1 Tax=Iodidimonas nitroreducens TaxID=1236968 RepID=A0A5A7N8S3_9PROT|nr:bacterioferritin-associated ferredoxin [alpha proteobacterium Q-1]GER04743.1 hypothetical protein JCM17846_24250 [Iodidimonas nitroreducens]
MYVCICNGLTEKRVLAAARETGERRSVGALYKKMGCKPQCGMCLTHAKTIIKQDDYAAKIRDKAEDCVEAAMGFGHGAPVSL